MTGWRGPRGRTQSARLQAYDHRADVLSAGVRCAEPGEQGFGEVVGGEDGVAGEGVGETVTGVDVLAAEFDERAEGRDKKSPAHTYPHG
ncbi:hypothetical protein [Streptomyces adustus]